MTLLVPLALAVALAPEVPSARAPSPSREVVDGLVRRARGLDLASDAQWLRLGHWHRGLLGWKSEALTREFFVAPDGATSPSHELEATLAAFFEPPVTEPAQEENVPFGAMHAQCRFPARL